MTQPKILFPFAINSDPSKIRTFESCTKWGYKHLDTDVIDMSLGSCGCLPLGFTRTDFAQAVQENHYPFLSGDFLTTNEHIIELSDKLFSLSNGYNSIFAVSGSDTVEAALKVAKLYHNLKGNTSKKIMLGFEESYHGSTFLSSSVSGSTYFHDINGRHPDCYSLPYDLDKVEIIIKDLGAENISSLIIETCSWQAGLFSYSKEWWTRLQELCNRNNIIFIIDDIAFCGGKTGKFFGFDSYITPDIICAGKALSGGYFPLSVCLISEEIYSITKETRFMHGFSYSFSMSGILSALHYLKTLDAERIYEQYDLIKETATVIFDNLKNLPSVKDVRNYGLTWCIDLNIENITNDYLIELFFKNGLYLGLWNSPAITKRILIHIPNIHDDNYFNTVNARLTAVLKNI
jgi:adenosylmethionine-8-amino-7-oxononanoate aminotransferase